MEALSKADFLSGGAVDRSLLHRRVSTYGVADSPMSRRCVASKQDPAIFDLVFLHAVQSQ